ncbi:MAG TPA: aminotransferase class I/II-fold pyridoxal phosphate-dependent enzyme [Thermoanaerobaculia bacterium]|nr:aminotransferase class I/II-fold pyridoxal phosphate-dependent enzyme [Thermoanaerobaculia bacterium]
MGDLGASGPGGTGQIGLQDMLGQVDLVMGSFSKTFGSNGGFVATNDRSVRQYLGIYGGSHMYSNGLSPVQAGVVLAALDIVRGPEGAILREQSFDNILRLRAGFEVRGVECLGEPSNVVPVMAGDDTVGKWTGRLLEENGLIANLVEFPAVPRERARFRFQVMATHTQQQIDRGVEVFCRCLDEAKGMMG